MVCLIAQSNQPLDYLQVSKIRLKRLGFRITIKIYFSNITQWNETVLNTSRTPGNARANITRNAFDRFKKNFVILQIQGKKKFGVSLPRSLFLLCNFRCLVYGIRDDGSGIVFCFLDTRLPLPKSPHRLLARRLRASRITLEKMFSYFHLFSHN